MAYWNHSRIKESSCESNTSRDMNECVILIKYSPRKCIADECASILPY